LTLTLWEVSQIVFAIFILFFLKNLFSDPVKRDIFWGYVPTVIVLLRDKKTNKFVLIGKNFIDGDDEEPSMVWHLPQTTVESPDIKDAVVRSMKAKFGLDMQYYDFTDNQLVMDRLRIKGLKKEIPSGLGFSLFRNGRGRIYRVIELKSDIEEREGELYIMGHKLNSVNIDSVVLKNKEDALNAIIESHMGYERREGKIPMYQKIFDELGDSL
jgi:hypothetical protein